MKWIYVVYGNNENNENKQTTRQTPLIRRKKVNKDKSKYYVRSSTM